MTPACSSTSTGPRSRHSHEHEHRDDLPTPSQVCRNLIHKTALGEIAWHRTAINSWQGLMGSARLTLDQHGLVVCGPQGDLVVAIRAGETSEIQALVVQVHAMTITMPEPKRTNWHRSLGGIG